MKNQRVWYWLEGDNLVLYNGFLFEDDIGVSFMGIPHIEGSLVFVGEFE